jgi:type IX secretion system substrate protein
MKRSFLASAVLMFVFLAASAFADGPVTIRCELSGGFAPDTVMPGADFTIDFYMENASEEYAMGLSMTYALYSPDSISTVTYRDIGGQLGEPALVPSVLFLNGMEPGEYWSFWNRLITHSWDGALPDTFHYLAVSITPPDGWPDEPEAKYIQIGMNIAEEGTFCIDSINLGAAFYDWAWGIAQIPTFEGTDVGHCFVVNDPANAFDEHGNLIPDDWSLSQNYPNPFNPATQIDFEVPYQSNVAITVYNVLGQRIKTLVDKEYIAGFYSETWNGDTDNGGPAASGIYFYKLEGDDFANTRKMMLLK